MAEDLYVDAAVVGAGAIGASSAYRLARDGRKVVVLETFAGPAEGSTGRSFASIRGQWADELNIALSWRSIQQFRDFPAEHGIDVGYRPTGYLMLVPSKAWAVQLEAVSLQREHGVPVEVLSLEAAKRMTPFESVGLEGATWGTADGVVDPHLLTTAYLDMARSHGAQVLYRHRVTAIERHDDGSWCLRAADRTVRAEYLVNAAGGWAGDLAAVAGLSVPVVHSRRNIYSSASGALTARLPMTIDVDSGVYLRSDGPRLLIGRSRPDQEDGYITDVDWPWMEAVLEIGMKRFPWLEDLPLDPAGCWAGTYENTPDHQGILDTAPHEPTWINACGFSGHGLMQSPEIGRLVAEQVVEGAITSFDTTPLRLARFDAGAMTPDAVGLVF